MKPPLLSVSVYVTVGPQGLHRRRPENGRMTDEGKMREIKAQEKHHTIRILRELNPQKSDVAVCACQALRSGSNRKERKKKPSNL